MAIPGGSRRKVCTMRRGRLASSTMLAGPFFFTYKLLQEPPGITCFLVQSSNILKSMFALCTAINASSASVQAGRLPPKNGMSGSYHVYSADPPDISQPRNKPDLSFWKIRLAWKHHFSDIPTCGAEFKLF